jgi:hypothetical protein
MKTFAIFIAIFSLVLLFVTSFVFRTDFIYQKEEILEIIKSMDYIILGAVVVLLIAVGRQMTR